MPASLPLFTAFPRFANGCSLPYPWEVAECGSGTSVGSVGPSPPAGLRGNLSPGPVGERAVPASSVGLEGLLFADPDPRPPLLRPQPYVFGATSQQGKPAWAEKGPAMYNPHPLHHPSRNEEQPDVSGC